MNKIIIQRLFESFKDLETAIESAKKTLEDRVDPPQEVIKRIESYEEILNKQRALATALCGHAHLGNWEEVSRHVKLINGLSTMIRDDAREIVSGIRFSPSREEREMLML